jgi:hypothetical protein
MQKPYNIRQLNYLYTIAASTLMRIMEVYDFDMRAIEAEIEDLVGMTEASSNDDTCPITVISHDLPWTTPSVVLHGAENEHPTMDVNTFRAVGEEVDGSNALRVVVCPTRFSKRKHTRGEKCAKCCEAAFASYRFGKCMKELKAGPKRDKIGDYKKVFVTEQRVDDAKDEIGKSDDLEILMFNLELG